MSANRYSPDEYLSSFRYDTQSQYPIMQQPLLIDDDDQPPAQQHRSLTPLLESMLAESSQDAPVADTQMADTPMPASRKRRAPATQNTQRKKAPQAGVPRHNWTDEQTQFLLTEVICLRNSGFSAGAYINEAGFHTIGANLAKQFNCRVLSTQQMRNRLDKVKKEASLWNRFLKATSGWTRDMDGNLVNSQDVMDDFFADPAHKDFLIFRGNHPVFEELGRELCGDGTATGDWAQSFNETLAAFDKGKGRQVRADAEEDDEEAEEAQDDGEEDAPDASTPKTTSAKTPKKGKGSSKKPDDVVWLLEGMKEMTGDVIAANPFKAIETANDIKKKAWDMLMTDNQSFCLDEWKDEKGDMKGDVLLEFWDEIGRNEAFALSFVEIAKAPEALRRRHLEREFRRFGRGTTSE